MDPIKVVVRPRIEHVIAKVPIDVVIPAQIPYPFYCFSAYCQRGTIKFKEMTIKLDDGLIYCSWRDKPDDQEKELLLDYGVFSH